MISDPSFFVPDPVAVEIAAENRLFTVEPKRIGCNSLIKLADVISLCFPTDFRGPDGNE